MTPENAAALRLQLIAHEGRRLFPYVDSVGKITIGIGHNLTDKGLTDRQVEQIYADDVAEIDTALRADVPWFLRLDPVRQRVLLDLAFNVGVDGLLKFHRLLAAAQIGEFGTAAQEILHSQIAPGRRERLATLLREGTVA